MCCLLRLLIADLIVFRFLTLTTRLTLRDLDPIYFPNCVRIYPTVNSTGGDLAVRPVISLGNRQGGNGPTGVCTWILEGCSNRCSERRYVQHCSKTLQLLLFLWYSRPKLWSHDFGYGLYYQVAGTVLSTLVNREILGLDLGTDITHP